MGDKQVGAGRVDASARSAAIARARATGQLQPIKDEAGNLLYYVDGAGNERAAPAQTQPAPKSTPAPAGKQKDASAAYDASIQSTVQQTQDQWLADQGFNAPVQQAKAKAQQQQQDATQQNSDEVAALAQYNATHPPVWVNGQQMVVTSLTPDGHPKTLAYVGVRDTKGNVSSAASQIGGSNNPSEVVDPTTGMPLQTGGSFTTAFDALNVGGSFGVLAGIKGNDVFTMASGPTNVMTGMPTSDSSFSSKLGDHGSEANTVANGQSQMTIAEGVQWLAKLANQNPQAYNTMVQQLKHAGYTGASGEPLTGGGYSETVGMAFAKAAKDLSVQQQATGSTMGMDEFLANRMQAVKDAAGATYQPTVRDYTDNGTLQAAAKSAAEEAIGRNLTPQELATFQQSFKGQQSAYYDQYDAAKKAQAEAQAAGESAPGPSGTAPDASGQASALVQGPGFQQDRANYQVQQYTQALAQLFGVK